jgi:hypothetical protein
MDSNLIAWHDYHTDSFDAGLARNERRCDDPVRVANPLPKAQRPFRRSRRRRVQYGPWARSCRQ